MTIPILARPPAPPASTRWHPRWLLAAPHRLCFGAGALVLGASAAWWALALLARTLGLALPWQLPPGQAHGLVMGFGFMPLFFAGFLFTAGPKWLDRPPVAAQGLLPPVAASLLGWSLFVVGAHVERILAAGGLALAAAAFAALTLRFARLVAASRAPDQLHARLVLTGCVIGSLALWTAAAAVALRLPALVQAVTALALWASIALVFIVVVHRMLPFFSAAALPLLDAWRPTALLWLQVGAVLAEAVLAAAESLWWPLPPPLRAVQAAGEAGIAALLLWLALRWGLVQSLRIRLLAMLHLGFVWLGLAFALGAVSHGLMAVSGGELSLGLAPLHALTAGFCGSLLLAMATRVSAGHGGRPLAADGVAWGLFWLLQAAVMARLLGALWPAASGVLLPLAALAWAGAMVGWALRHGRWYGTPRADGRPG